MYKKALNSFFLKVHPDFFQHSAEQQQVNEGAVAQLNEILSWAKEFKTGVRRPPPANRIDFTFYKRGNDDSNDNFRSADKITSTFELPAGFSASEANQGMAERSVNKFLRDLLRRADCLDSVAESMSAAEDATAARLEAKPLRKRPQRGSDKTKQKKKEEESAASSLLDDAVEAIHTRWTLTPAPTVEELIESDLILFDKDVLSPLQSSAALYTLKSSLGEMQYDRWESMPLVISDHFAIGETLTGSLTIPYDFTPIQFIQFLQFNAEKVDACRQEATQFANKLEVLIAELCNHLKLDDILISCSHREALTCLTLLHRYKEILFGYGVTELTLEIGTRHATRANGVLIIDYRTHTYEALEQWLRAVQPKLEVQKKLYDLSKKMLEATTWHLKEFRAVVQPAGIECFHNNDYTYAQRLAWAKELFRISPSLAQWDWSEFQFELSPLLEINWEGRQMCLPYNFDGDALIHYITDIQKNAKTTAREALLAESAMKDLALEQDKAREHARQLQLEEDGFTEDPPVLSPEGTAEREDRLRQLYRKTNPNLEEYLSSANQPDRTTYHNEPLKMERPLSHAVTFNSDEEADEQLRWEGFYQSPFVDQVPTGDLDDMDHTFQLSNRWHREAAAKKLLEELQSTYGKKSRKFDYKKMGDVLEINNVNVQPKGFPVLNRGLRSGRDH
ncbi:hypothetical protein AGDE_04672 [Angomonas deanei]|nr:hypothetical protein AGDE_04672 [Angomonas deanei]|eukprot:EPY39256.1 hypothetical protein AGDE_04672 [Angomonas deanei]